MAKLTLQRFPDPRPEYDAQQSAELIRQLALHEISPKNNPDDNLEAIVPTKESTLNPTTEK